MDRPRENLMNSLVMAQDIVSSVRCCCCCWLIPCGSRDRAGDPMHRERCPKVKFPLRCHECSTQAQRIVYSNLTLRRQITKSALVCPSESGIQKRAEGRPQHH